MKYYWLRHRLPFAVVFVCTAVLFIGLISVYPYIDRQASEYNAQSVFVNTSFDFIAPDPSFEQIADITGKNGIAQLFPFYATKTTVSVNGHTRSTQVLLSDQFENVDMTMYNEARLIEKSDRAYENPILVDWQFCKDTSASIGDVVSIPLGNNTTEFTVSAIYETNAIYGGGAVLAKISTAERDAIAKNAKSNGYSGAYIVASDYSKCRTYLITDYRPLGRLKDRAVFDSDEAYNIHFHAIMDSGFANEITDLKVKESSLKAEQNDSLLWVGTAIAFVLFIVFAIVMSKRASEWGYFTKHCIPAGLDVKPFYACSFLFEVILFAVLFMLSLMVLRNMVNQFIPAGTIDTKFAIIPIAVVIADAIGIFISLNALNRFSHWLETRKKDDNTSYRRHAD
jgi:hypothetical protein